MAMRQRFAADEGPVPLSARVVAERDVVSEVRPGRFVMYTPTRTLRPKKGVF